MTKTTGTIHIDCTEPQPEKDLLEFRLVLSPMGDAVNLVARRASKSLDSWWYVARVDRTDGLTLFSDIPPEVGLPLDKHNQYTIKVNPKTC